MKKGIEMIDREASEVSIRRQCELTGASRGKFYYKKKGESESNIKLMSIMDKHLLEYPTEGVNSMVYYLRDQGHRVNPKRIRRLFRIMGHQTVYRVRNLTKLGHSEYIKPYLLRNLKIERSNQVWCTDITYIPMRKGFMYLTALMDVYSRKILSWEISNSMTAEWVIEVLENAIEKHGKPEIINSDQGTQYTSKIWTDYLETQRIKISMDGKGRATDNTWIERFWKTIKVNHIHLNPAQDGIELRNGIGKYIDYYNEKTHHTTKEKPTKRYCDSISTQAA